MKSVMYCRISLALLVILAAFLPEPATAQTSRPGGPIGPIDPSPIPAGWTCTGNCGTDGADGVVRLSPAGNSTYEWVSTSGGTLGAGVLPAAALGSETNGSTLATPVFSATAGTALTFFFNYVTSDGAGYGDYAWAELYTASNTPVALLFTTRTSPSGNTVPGTGMPAPMATLTPASAPIISGGPVWPELGPYSRGCWSTGCGYTGWVQANYTIPTTGNYYLKVGVVNWIDQAYDSGLAVDGITIGAAGTGTITITTTQIGGQPLVGAPFTLSKNGAFYTSGTIPYPTITASAGSYTITYGDVAGYTTPAPQTKLLVPAESLLFNGIYTPIPVIVIPGILGTSLYNEGDLLWVDPYELVLGIQGDLLDLQSLALTATGSSAPHITTGQLLDGTEVIPPLNGRVDYYGGLEAALLQNNRPVFTFPYDWRLDNAGNADLLNTFIEKTVLLVSGASKVDIVAHSMGGLLVRRYAREYGVGRIRKVIYLATPHLGSPNSFGELSFNNSLGQFLHIDFIPDATLAILSRTFPSVFELLPRYPFVFSDTLGSKLTLDQSYRQPPTGFGFLASSSWVDTANQFHQSIAADLNIAQYLIAGSGLPTITQFTLKTDPSIQPRRWCVESGDGDNTVPTTSATGIGAVGVFYVNQVEHSKIPNNATVQQVVLGILADNLTSLPPGVSTTAFQAPKRAEWCTGSPISVTISDTGSRVDGIGTDGATKLGIPGSSFVVFENNQGGVLESNQPYQFTVTGTGTGVFSLTVQEKDETGNSLGTIQFRDIPVGAHSIGTFSLVPDNFTPVLSLDVDGNGTVDVIIAANQPIAPGASVSILEMIVQGLGLDKGITTSLLAKLDAALSSLQRGQNGAASGQLGAFANEVSAQARKSIPLADAQGLLTVVNHILASL